MAFNFTFGAQPQAAPTNAVHLTEQMLLKDLAADVLDEFIGVYNSMSENRDAQPIDVSRSVEADVEMIKSEIAKTSQGPLMAAARQIDSAMGTLKGLKEELQQAQVDLNGSTQGRDLPTPFITRFVENTERTSERISRDLQAQSARFHSVTKEPLLDLLRNEHTASLRCSSKIAELQEQLEEVRIEFEGRTGVKLDKVRALDIEADTCVQDLRNMAEQFESDKIRKEETRAKHSDLFGASTLPPPQQKNSKSMFG